MINRAVILADMVTNNIFGSFNKIKPLNPLLGISLLKRAILSSNDAGIKNFVIVVGCYAKEIETKILKDKQLKKKDIKIEFAHNKNFDLNDGSTLLSLEKFSPEPFFLLRADHIIEKNILLEMAQNFSSDNVEYLLGVSRVPNGNKASSKVIVSIEENKIFSIGDLEKFNFYNTGIYLFKPSIFKALKSFKENQKYDFKISEVLNVECKNTNIAFFDMTNYLWHLVDSPEDYKAVEKKLLNSVRKPTDGVIAKNINRYVSLFLTKYILKVITAPNVVTVGNLLIGLSSAYFIALGGYFYSLIGGLLFQLASITDGCDGEVAKLTYRTSRYGEWFDTICDNITYIAFLTCLPIGLYRYHQHFLYIILGSMTFVAAVSFVFLMVHHIRKIEGGGSLVKIVKDMESQAEFNLKSFTNTINFLISKVAFTMRRDFFALFFLILCLVGFSYIIQWLAVTVLTFACFYFYFYSKKNLKLLSIN